MFKGETEKGRERETEMVSHTFHTQFIWTKISPATSCQLCVVSSWMEVGEIDFLIFQPSYLIASHPHPGDNWIPVGYRSTRDKEKEAFQIPAGKHPHCSQTNDLRCDDDSEIKTWADVPLHSAALMWYPCRALVTSSFIWLFWQTGARSAAAFLVFAIVLEPLVSRPPQEGSGRQGDWWMQTSSPWPCPTFMMFCRETQRNGQQIFPSPVFPLGVTGVTPVSCRAPPSCLFLSSLLYVSLCFAGGNVISTRHDARTLLLFVLQIWKEGSEAFSPPSVRIVR